MDEREQRGTSEEESVDTGPDKVDDSQSEQPDGQASPPVVGKGADSDSAEGETEVTRLDKSDESQEEKPEGQAPPPVVEKSADSVLVGRESEHREVEKVDSFHKDQPVEQPSSPLIDRMGRGLIRLLGRLPLISRLSPNRWNPRAVAVATLVVVLAASFTAFAFSGMSDADVPEAGETVRNDPEKSPEKPPEPAMFILQHKERKWEIDLRSIGYDGEDIGTVDQKKLKEWLEKVKEEVDEPAKDARMARWGGPIQPSKEGQRMDLQEIEENWLPHLSDYINKPQDIPIIVEKPRVTEEDLRKVNQRRIGRYTTYFDASNVNRTTNIRLSAQAINNLVLNPGDIFSFNRVVGPRTVQRGYKPATVIVRGEYSEGIGGGICQTSSTLYNSVSAAGLRVTLRYSHSKEVTYVPAGRDATVSWGGPDFRFANSIDKPIMIKTYVGDGFITVSIYTTPDAKVTPRYVPPAPRWKPKQIKVDPDRPSNETPENGSNRGGNSGNSPGSGGGSPGNNDGNLGGDDPPGDDEGDEGDDGGSGTMFP